MFEVSEVIFEFRVTLVQYPQSLDYSCPIPLKYIVTYNLVSNCVEFNDTNAPTYIAVCIFINIKRKEINFEDRGVL